MRENTDQNNSKYGHFLRSRILPVNMDDMERLKESDPAVYVRLSLYMEVQIPFTAVDHDYACEQVNKLMKIKREIKGIIHSNSATTEYTLAAPALKEITHKVKIMVGLSHFRPMFPFYTPSKHQKIKDFLVFSGGIK